MSIIERIKTRLDGETYAENLLTELADTIRDRLCLRMHVDALPERFESILVDATVKAWRRRFYEGITSEGNVNITTSFVDDILAEYADEIDAGTDVKAAAESSGKVVRFL